MAGTAKERRASNAQAKVAALRAEEAARRRRTTMATAAVVVVVLVIAVLVGVKLANGNHKVAGGKSGLASPAVVKAITTIPASSFNAVGAGGIKPPFSTLPSSTPALTKDGKPRVLYGGAEYCPFCAAERWGLAIALSRFGTIENLGQTTSAGGDEYAPDTATLSFHGATYTSKYIVFNGYELQSNKLDASGNYAALDSMPSSDEAIFNKYDYPPYVSSKGAIPFIDFGGKVVSQGTAYDPMLLAGMTHLEIAKAASDPTSKAGKAILGTANLISAEICKLTDGQPASVCSSAGVTAAAASLG